MRDFFVSYSNKDSAWAEWIAWQLEDAGYSTFVQAWDFSPGQNFIERMQKGSAETRRTIAVLSPDYLASSFTQPEWYAAFAGDPTGEKGILLPVRVRECAVEGMLAGIIYVDLVGRGEAEARDALLRAAAPARARRRPVSSPPFPLGGVAAFPPAASVMPAAKSSPVIGTPPPAGVRYVVRPTPSRFAGHLSEQPGVIVVIGARHGATATIADGLRGVVDAGGAVVLADIENLSPARMEGTGKAFYFALGAILARQLHLPRSLREVWDEDLPGAASMSAFMRDEILASVSGHVVCVLDSIDMLLPCAFRDDVFGLLRSWHNSRATDPAGGWERLTLVLICRAHPGQFIRDPNRSPFNVGTWVVL